MRTLIIVGAAAFAFAGAAGAAEHTVSQKANAFSVSTLKVKVGDEVSFKNDDTVFHNTFSLSDAQTFDLGSYGPGTAKKVKFDKPGKVEVECAIHPNMKMVVDATK